MTEGSKGVYQARVRFVSVTHCVRESMVGMFYVQPIHTTHHYHLYLQILHEL